jgi:hypothetical protein
VRKALSLAAALTILAAGGCGGDDEVKGFAVAWG